MADQLRFDALGCAGAFPPSNGTYSPTPNLDALAAQGVRFTNAYSATPTCTPARSALLTGMTPWNHGLLGYGNTVAPLGLRFEGPREFATRGYFAAQFGKDHFGWDTFSDSGIAHGFNSTLVYDGIGTGLANNDDGNEYDDYDKWFQTVMPGANPTASGGLDWNSWRGAAFMYNESVHPTAWIGSNTVEFIRNWTSAHGSDEPFFLKASFHRPHSPYDPPARLLNATDVALLPPMRVGGNWDAQFANTSGCGPSDPDAWCGAMPSNDTDVSRRAYHANVQFVDEWIGTIMETLNDTGALANTFVIFVSDHGDGQGDHNLWRKGYPYELSTHVPMIVRWQDNFNATLARGSTSALLTELRDVMPTLLDAAGMWPPAGVTLDGSPLTCLLRDPSGATCPATSAGGLGGTRSSGGQAGWREYIDMEHDIVYANNIHWNGLTDGKMKYVYWAMTGSEQLFNMTADPYEYTDVSALPAYSGVLASWRARLVAQFQAEGRGPTWVRSNGTLVPRPEGQLYSYNYPNITA
jgi:arylsulfatase